MFIEKILPILILFPLIGVAVLMLADPKSESSYRITIFTTFINFVLSLSLFGNYNENIISTIAVPAYQFIEQYSLIVNNQQYGSIILGVDSLSIWFIFLTTLLFPLCILYSKGKITKYTKEYFISFLVLEAAIIGVFSAIDLLSFYIFFEMVLIPMFVIIGIWGGDKRIYATFKLFLFTLAGSVLFLVVILYLYNTLDTLDSRIIIYKLAKSRDIFSHQEELLLWLGMFIAFAVKLPMWPLHSWLPDAHLQAPTVGSVILAGILIKMGGYAMIRFNLGFFPEISVEMANYVIYLSIIAVVYVSILTLLQKDIKKMIAYSSVAHMGFVTAGIFSHNSIGLTGAIYQMISHGIISAALFFCIGMIYERTHTRHINNFGSLASTMPNYSIFFMIFTLASIGLPLTSGFVGESLVIIGLFEYNKIFSFGIALGMIFGACYMLYLYYKIIFAKTDNHFDNILDLSKREIFILSIFAIMTIGIGIYPSLVTDFFENTYKLNLPNADLS